MSFESLQNVVESCPIRGRTVNRIGTIKCPELCWVGQCSAHYALTVPRSIFKCSEEVALCYAAMHLFVSLSGKEAWSFLAAIIPPLRWLLTRHIGASIELLLHFTPIPIWSVSGPFIHGMSVLSLCCTVFYLFVIYFIFFELPSHSASSFYLLSSLSWPRVQKIEKFLVCQFNLIDAGNCGHFIWSSAGKGSRKQWSRPS